MRATEKCKIINVLLIITVLTLLFTCIAPITAVFAADTFYGKVPGVNEFSRICFWYGILDQTKVDILKTYDIVVLEPTLKVLNVAKNQFYLESLTTNQINEIKRGVDGILGTDDDVIVLGYISVGEMLKTIIPGQSGHMTIQQGINLGLLPENYSGPSGPVHGPNPWNFNSSGQYIDVEGGAIPDGTYDDGYDGYSELYIAEDYSSWGSRLTWANKGYMPWYLDQQGAPSDWITDNRYPQCGNGYWKKGDGEIDVNKYYGGGYINAGDPAWQKFVLFQVDKLVHDCDFDGVFLDTVDTPDPVGGVGPHISWGPRGNFGWTAKGMVELVEKIKAVNPSKIVASNRGYWYFNPDEGTSQFSDRYRRAINMFITESWYYNCYIPDFYDETPGFEGNWNTDPTSPDYRSRDNFGGYWKEYMNAHADREDGFNIAIIDFMVPSSGTDKWMNEVVLNSGYLGYIVSGAQHFNANIFNDAKNWLDARGYTSPGLAGFHDTETYGGFIVDGDFSEWENEIPIYHDPQGNNGKGITRIYVRFVNDKCFMMIESKNNLNMVQEQILFDFDQDGPSGWQPYWPVSPDARIYFENVNQAYLLPYLGPGETFKFNSPNSPSNRGWPVKFVQKGTKCELEFKKEYIFGPENWNNEIWVYFRQANFGGSSISFDVPPDGPRISNVRAESISDTSQLITWTTDVPSGSEVEYGLTSSYGYVASSPGNVTSHSVLLTNLTKGTTYHFRVKSTDSDGRTSVSPDYTFVTTDSTAPPVISDVQVTGITATQATISWKTDQPSNSTVEYGLTASYGNTISDADMVTNHSITITGLSPSTTYNFRVKSTNANNITGTSPNYTFTTLTPLAVSEINVADIGNTTATITWKTNLPADSKVDYGMTQDLGLTRYDAANVLNHSITLTGLTRNTTYYYRITSKDNDGQVIQSEVYSFITANHEEYPEIIVDGNPSDWEGITPVATSSTSVSKLVVANDDNNLYLLVEGTGLNVKGQFYIDTDNDKSTGYNPTGWGQSGADYLLENNYLWKYNGTNNSWSWTNAKIISAYSKNDSVVEAAIPLSELGISTNSTIGVGYLKNDSLTERLPLNGQDLPTVTLSAIPGGDPQPVLPVISDIQVSNITQTSATVTWKTDLPSNSKVEYGTTTNYGNIKENPELVTNHSITLTGLNSGTEYHFRVHSANGAGTATSGDYTFTTLQEAPGGQIVIDGNFSDWQTVPVYAQDPLDAGGGSGDAKALYVESGEGKLFVKLDVYGTFSMSTVNILYIDSDNTAGTGYYGGGWPSFGAEYRIVYSNGFNPPKLQRFAGGSQGNDSWTDVAVLNASYNGGSAELEIPYSYIGVSSDTTIKLLFRANQDAAPDFWQASKPVYKLK